MKKVFLSLIFYFLVFGAEAAVAIGVDNCSDLAELNQKWKTKYYHQLNVQNIPLVDLKCNDANYKIAKAVSLLEDFNSPTLKFNFYADMIVQTIKGLTVGYVAGGDAAWCASTNRHTKIVTLRDCFFTEDVYYRAGNLVHEARHAELGVAGKHVVCEGGGRVGTQNCDIEFVNDWDRAGPYSYEVMVYRKLYDNSDRFGFDKKSLKQLINGTLNWNFNFIDTGIKEKYYIR